MKIFSIGSASSPFEANLTEYQGNKCIDLRHWYLDKKLKELKPTPKGLTLSKTKFFTLMDELFEHSKEIEDWFSSDKSIKNSTSREDSNYILPPKTLKVFFRKMGSHTMFEIEEKGGESDLFINENSKLGGLLAQLLGSKNGFSLGDMDDDKLELIFLLIISFLRALNKTTFDDHDQKVHNLMCDLELEWKRKFEAIINE